MAKSQRSSFKKAIRAQRRDKLKATWQDEADRRRYEALARAAGSEPVAATTRIANEDSMVVAEESRRSVRPAKAAADDATMAVDSDKLPTKGKRKGVKIGRGVQKTHNKKKVSALWVSNFHKSKKGKKGLAG